MALKLENKTGAKNTLNKQKENKKMENQVTTPEKGMDNEVATSQATGEVIEMIVETTILLSGPQGKQVAIKINGVDADGRLIIETDLPEEFSGEVFQNILAGTILNMFAGMRMVRRSREEVEALHAKLLAQKEKSAKEIAELDEIVDGDKEMKASVEATFEEPKATIRLGKRGQA